MMRQRLPKFVNTVTYSTCLYSKQLQEAGFTTANNCMILTCWQQIDGQKTNRIVHASVKDHYFKKKRAYSMRIARICLEEIELAILMNITSLLISVL